MVPSFRSDPLFAVALIALAYILYGVPAAAAVSAIFLVGSVSWSGAITYVRAAGAKALASAKGMKSGGSTLSSPRWLLVAFVAGVLVGRGGFSMPDIRLPSLSGWQINLPDILRIAPPAPIKEPGLTVMIVREATEGGLTPAQISAIDSREFADYLDDKDARWRKFDRDNPPVMEAEVWRKAWADHVEGKPDTAFPLLIVSDGKTGFVKPMPADRGELMAAVKSVGGQ